MNVLSSAISEYKKENYKRALELFNEAGNLYGNDIVSFHVEKCKEALGLSENYSNNFAKSIELDLATQIMSFGKRKNLSSHDKENLIKNWKAIVSKRSENAEVKNVNPIPGDFPKDLILPALPEGPNDFKWNKVRKIRSSIKIEQPKEIGLSVVIPTFNRSRILAITLSCLVNQKSKYPFEVIIADDGSKEDICSVVRNYEKDLDIKYVRQKDYGYQLCAIRNLGLRSAKYDLVSILDCDMAPNPLWVQSYVELLLEDDDVALIGPRKYVDTKNVSPDSIRLDSQLICTLPEIRTNNNVAGKDAGDISVDWRLEHFKKTENLRLCDSPFRYFSGGNVAFSKKWLVKAGWFDEEFTYWGGEDNEFGYRLFKNGCYFRAVEGGMAYHQEPPGAENETDRAEGKKITLNIVKEKVPYYYRKLQPIESAVIHKVPLVTIYVPAYNCADSIQRCVDSALNQTVTDLQVCICNDGSTDNTLEVIESLYGQNPRVKILNQKNGGIAVASNSAVKAADGYYIAQLDSDDYLEPDAVEICLNEFLKDRSLACVYTTNRNVNPDGSLIANGYNWSVFSREKLITAMIVHHFRMFTARAWHLTSGFDEKIENSVDLDIYLKLSEVGPFKHVNKICYNRVLHGNNTSIKKLGIQKKNHFLVVNKSLNRQGITHYQYSAIDDNDESRKYTFIKNFDNPTPVLTNNNHTKLAFSLVYPDQLDNLLKKLNNIIEYNNGVVAIIVHINPQYINNNITNKLSEFEKQHKLKVIVNSAIEYNNFKYRQVNYYLDNFNKLLESGINFDYVIFDNYDSLYVQPGSSDYMVKFDIGMNFGKINGYWQEKIVSHQALRHWVSQKISMNISDLACKGMVQGMFLNVNSAKAIFALLSEFLQLCKQTNDLPKYPTEEILFQVMASIAEKEQGKSFKKSPTLTYMPWDRKLQWTTEQIEQARQGIGISKNKFLINSIRDK
ncbi:glycosyltransferase, group 2 family protein [Actinobacillus ureae ATCC 25976]|uniref:Glycosyltransferase, group 2 family protein n=1 Tax=Actinobacillus ureae ATCC 25976 TaxID=887324 RepID=E8KE54_9PAST|nr:glycosyltransferase [Actinobacillus ureae]EFX92829.1 glycosyltransferase, group 2 family protein [Actinobacillus ureae ATCC 25976]